MIKISNLTKSINNKYILKDVSFTIEKNDVFGIIGKSGSGKTTLLDCISGLKSYDNGSISIDGKEISKLNTDEIRNIRKNIGFIFQDFSLLKRRNVLDNIALPMKCWKKDKHFIKEKSLELASLVGLEEHIYKRPKELSGGQQQRVAISRALSLNPKYIICDEFTSALDPSTTNSILKLIMNIKKNSDLTLIVVTHDMNIAKKICNKVVVLEDGEIVDFGNTDEVFSKNSTAIKRLLGKEDDKNE